MVFTTATQAKYALDWWPRQTPGKNFPREHATAAGAGGADTDGGLLSFRRWVNAGALGVEAGGRPQQPAAGPAPNPSVSDAEREHSLGVFTYKLRGRMGPTGRPGRGLPCGTIKVDFEAESRYGSCLRTGPDQGWWPTFS